MRLLHWATGLWIAAIFAAAIVINPWLAVLVGVAPFVMLFLPSHVPREVDPGLYPDPDMFKETDPVGKRARRAVKGFATALKSAILAAITFAARVAMFVVAFVRVKFALRGNSRAGPSTFSYAFGQNVLANHSAIDAGIWKKMRAGAAGYDLLEGGQRLKIGSVGGLRTA